MIPFIVIRIDLVPITKEKLFFLLEKLKNWLSDTETNEKISDDKSLKKELPSLINLNIVKHGRPFCDRMFIKNIL